MATENEYRLAYEQLQKRHAELHEHAAKMRQRLAELEAAAKDVVDVFYDTSTYEHLSGLRRYAQSMKQLEKLSDRIEGLKYILANPSPGDAGEESE